VNNVFVARAPGDGDDGGGGGVAADLGGDAPFEGDHSDAEACQWLPPRLSRMSTIRVVDGMPKCVIGRRCDPCGEGERTRGD
jgi:hypothetical protein